MRIKYLLLLLPALFLAVACSNSSSETADGDSEGEGMEQFADDKEFQDQHETPAKMDFDGAGEMVTFATPDGQEGSAYAILPDNPTENYLFVIHEWWGLNDQIKKEADRLASELEGTTVMALDLYDGNVTDDQAQAGKYMEQASAKPDRLEAIIKGALAKAGEDAKVATIGWCFGGGWSLRTSILAGDQGAGCVMYYGMPVEKADQIAPLKADILGIFAKEDKWINEEVIGKFEGLAKATGKDIETHWFEADHAFANPSSPRYNEEAAQKANTLALNFLKEHL
jgi:carboxymethylenebutenolidase